MAKKRNQARTFIEPPTEIHACSFVLSSSLVNALPKACQAWSDRAAMTMTWGSANRTFVDRDFYLDMTNDAIEECQSHSAKKQLETLKNRVLRLPKNVYIDLEN